MSIRFGCKARNACMLTYLQATVSYCQRRKASLVNSRRSRIAAARIEHRRAAWVSDGTQVRDVTAPPPPRPWLAGPFCQPGQPALASQPARGSRRTAPCTLHTPGPPSPAHSRNFNRLRAARQAKVVTTTARRPRSANETKEGGWEGGELGN